MQVILLGFSREILGNFLNFSTAYLLKIPEKNPEVNPKKPTEKPTCKTWKLSIDFVVQKVQDHNPLNPQNKSNNIYRKYIFGVL